MADIIDEASELRDREDAARVKAVRDRADQIPAGEPGECELCGNLSGRLVDGACAPCRDRYRLP